jgi:tetratricopeptide (TPR) repeat protein
MYDKARLINTAHKLALYNSAFIALYQRKYEKCVDLCNTYIEMDDNNANAFALRGAAYEKSGNKKAALQDYNAALDIDPKNLPARTGKEMLSGE